MLCLVTGKPFVSCPIPEANLPKLTLPAEVTWQFSLAGLLVGVLVGMTGMGGGSLMTPILILLFNFDPKVAVGTDILHGAIFKSFGAVRHRMLGTVHARLALWMLAGSAPLSLVGVQVAHHIDTAQMQRAVGVALIVGGLGFLMKTFVHGHSRRRAVHPPARRQDRGGPARRDRRLRRRPHLGRLRHVLRPGDAVPLSADRLQDRRHRHAPRGDAALGHRAWRT